MQNQNQKRTHCVSSRLNSLELAELDAIRGQQQRGAFLRLAALSPTSPRPRPIPEASADALRQLRGLAANLNQLARHANQTEQLELTELSRLVADLRAVLIGLV